MPTLKRKMSLQGKRIKRINSWINRWKEPLFLQGWEFDLKFEDKDSENENTEAEIAADSKYSEAVITIYKPFFEQNSLHQEKTIVHELCHILTHELGDLVGRTMNGKLITQEEFVNTDERTTQKLCNIVYKIKNGGLD